MDILLGKDHDLYFMNGDIVLNNSISQKIKICLTWFLGEWRWDDEIGLPYFENLLIKNPEIDYFEELIKNEIFNLDEIIEVKEVSIIYDNKKRTAIIRYIALTDLETIQEEVYIYD